MLMTTPFINIDEIEMNDRSHQNPLYTGIKLSKENIFINTHKASKHKIIFKNTDY